MANTLGQLIVKMGLDAAEFTAGLTKSEYQAKKFADSLSNNVAIGIVKAEVAMQSFVAVAKFAVHEIPDLLKQAGDYQSFGEKIGDNAAAFASLAVAAKAGDVQLADVADTSIKLQKNLAKVNDATSGAGRAIKALGLDLKTFKDLSPTQQLETLGKALAGFEDKDKPVFLEALAKGGAQLLPFLKELGSGVGRVNILTAEQIALAHEFSDRQAKSRAELNLYAQALATEMVPALTALQDAVKDVIKEFLGLDGASKDLKGSTAVADFAEEGARSLATLADEGFAVAQTINLIAKSYGSAGAILGAVSRREFGSIPEIIKAARAEGEKMTFSLGLADKVEARFRKIREDRAAGTTTGDFARQDRKKLDTSGLVEGAADQARAVLKKKLEGDVKLIRDFAEQQKSGYEFANQYLKGVYDEGITSLSDFFDKQKALRSAGLQAELDGLDKTIAAERAYRNNPLTKPEEKVAADNKIKESEAAKATAIQKASQSNILSAQEEARAVKQLAFAYSDFLASVRESQGDAAGAAAIRNAKDRQAIQELLTKQGFSPAEAKRQADAQADRLLNTQYLNVAQADYNRLVESAGIKEKSALIDSQLAGKSEIETLTAITAIRQGALGSLGELVKKAYEFADAIGSPETRLFADKLALQFKQAAAEAEPLLLKVRELGKEAGESIASNFEEAILSGKSLRDTLKGIEQDLLRILIRSQITKPLGDFLGNLLGGNGTSSGGGGLFGQFLPGLFGSGGGVSASPNLGLDFFGVGLATGGPALPGSLHRVNENGPEMLDVNGKQFLMMGNQRGTVVPNDKSAQSSAQTVVFNVTVPGGTSRETALQIAALANQHLAMGRRGM